MRIYMAWFMKREHSLDERSLPNGCRVSVTPHNRFVFFEDNVELDEIKQLFLLFQQKGLHCRSINIFLPGNVPNLCLYGFEAQNGNVFSYPHSNIVSISAVPYGPHEWCYMMRSERSIPFRAIHTLPYFQKNEYQASLFDMRGEQYA